METNDRQNFIKMAKEMDPVSGGMKMGTKLQKKTG